MQACSVIVPDEAVTTRLNDSWVCADNHDLTLVKYSIRWKRDFKP